MRSVKSESNVGITGGRMKEIKLRIGGGQVNDSDVSLEATRGDGDKPRCRMVGVEGNCVTSLQS